MTKIKSFNRIKFICGIVLVLLGIIMPYAITIETIGISGKITEAIRTENSSSIIIAGVGLVFLNSIRAFPHYLGAFFIGESVEIDDSLPFAKTFKYVVICTIIPCVYYLIWLIHGIKYDFGIPAIVTILLLIIIGKQNYQYIRVEKLALLIIVFLTAFQFIDIMPMVAGMPLGRGETSQDIKLVSNFLHVDETLNFVSGIMFILLLGMGILIMFLIANENSLLEMNEIKEKAKKLEVEAQIKRLEDRTLKELKALVHDLKSPLTAAQAFISLVALKCNQDGRNKDVEYLKNAENSIESMSKMISEILYDDYGSFVTTRDIMKSVFAQLATTGAVPSISEKNDVPDKVICVNRIRFVRAIINLIDNAIYAVNNADDAIEIHIFGSKEDGEDHVIFSIEDKGKGIPEEILQEIWKDGFSMRGSHGLGLGFVKSVVNAAQGKIEIETSSGKGTKIKMMVPESVIKG